MAALAFGETHQGMHQVHQGASKSVSSGASYIGIMQGWGSCELGSIPSAPTKTK